MSGGLLAQHKKATLTDFVRRALRNIYAQAKLV
jgi:hypothetical protein